MKRILAVVAHADDELLGCGATLRRHVLAGDDVNVVVVADCRVVRNPTRVAMPDERCVRVAELMGFQPPFFLTFAGMSLARQPETGGVSTPGLNAAITEAVSAICPEVVYTHFRGDINSDHAAVSRAVGVACRPVGDTSPRCLLEFETPSSTEWGRTPFVPNVFVDVSQTLADKLGALAVYDEEMRPSPHPRNPEMLRARAAFWGQSAGLEAAEPFVLIREVR